jgi:hypothetical protein
MTEQEIITIWKELNVDRVEFKFSCGGDEMDTVDIFIYDNEENEIKSNEIEGFINDAVFEKVDFYEASDDYYMGESGTVTVTLIEDDGDEEPYFSYDKSSEGEYNERFSERVEIELTNEEAEFLKENVSNISGDDMEMNISYKNDVVIDDNVQKIISGLEKKVFDFLVTFQPKDFYGDENSQYEFTTNDEEDEELLEIVENKLKFTATKRAYVYKPMED